MFNSFPHRVMFAVFVYIYTNPPTCKAKKKVK